MKNRYFPMFLAILFLFILSNPAYGQHEEKKAFEKLARGAINVAVSPLELFQGIGDGFAEHDPALALPIGLFKGTTQTVKRLGVGLFEIFTFPLPIPENYEPLIEPPRFFGD